jgi:hypothetical protein
MVKSFGAEVQQANDPSYIGYSKEGSADTSLKKLFTGLAGVIDAKSNYYEEQSKKQADATAAEIVNATADAATVKGGEGSDTLIDPNKKTEDNPDIKKISEQGQKYTQLYAEGRITSSDYWSKMDAMVKTAKARYPSQADRIETQVALALGRRPASAAIEEKRDEYKSTLAQHNEEEKRFATFIDTNIEYLPPDFYNRVAEGRPYTKIETRKYVQDRQSEKLAVETKRNNLALKKEQGNLNEEEAVGVALDEVNGYTNRIILDTAGVSKDFTALLQSGRDKGKSFSPDEQMALRQSFAELKFKVQEGVENILSKPWADKSSNYLNQIKSPEKIKHIREQAMARIDYYEKLINDKDYGILNADINRTKAMKDEVNRKVLESSDQIRIFQAVKDQGGADLLDEMLLSKEGQKMKSDATKALRNITLGKVMSGEAKSMTDELRRADNANVPKGERGALNYRQIMDAANVLVNPKANLTIKGNVAKALFGPENADFISNFSGEYRTSLFTTLASPDVTKSILQLKDADPESWRMYRNWVKNSFGSLFRDLAADVQEGITTRPNINVTWDDATQQFNVASGPERKSDWRNPLAGATRAIENQFTNNVERGINEFNRQIRVLAPILKADNQDIGTELLGFFNSMGIDTMAPRDATFFTKMRQAMIRNWEKNNPKPAEGGEGTGKK